MRRAPWAAVLVAVLSGCATGPSSSSKQALNRLIAGEDYPGAENYVDKNKYRQYGKKNMVLFYLDKGLVQHHAGNYRESDRSFAAAESRMEELYTISVSQAGAMLLLNDTTMDYAGEPFERALVNVFRALNYVFLGKPDEALVESRKVELFLDELNRRLGDKNSYKDDAFARYLDSLLYQDGGKTDDSRISLEAAMAAYSWYSTAYKTPTPRFDFAQDQPGLGELVFIHYNGIAPRKVSKTFSVAWGRAVAIAQASPDTETDDSGFKNALAAGFLGHAVTVSYPDYVQDPFSISGSEVRVGSESFTSTRLMEDISAIASKSLGDRMAAIKIRAIARATVKFVIAESAARAADKSCEKRFGKDSWQTTLCSQASRGITHATAAATEIADTRSWSALPSQIRMARLRLPPGKHQVEVRFQNTSGQVVSTRVFKDVEIVKSKRTYLAYRTAL